MRGIASLSVAWLHLTNTATPLVRASGSLGWLGVDCFFVISGFVIPYSLRASGYRTADFGRFLARRLVRLEPPYIASIVLMVLLAFVSAHVPGFRGQQPAFSAPQLLAHLLYLIPLTKYHWVNLVYWTLAYEFVFYIACGLLFTLLWRRHLGFTIALSVAVFVAARLLTHAWDARILLFLFGISAMRWKTGRDRLWLFLGTVLATAATIAATGAIPSAIVGSASAMAVAFLKVPAYGPLTWLGTISYSLYLIHVPIGGRVVNLGDRLGGGELGHLAVSVVALVVSLAFAWLWYLAIERAATAASKAIQLKPSSRISPERVGSEYPARAGPE